MSILEPEAARARLAQTDITGHELAEIATRHPSLRVLVAAHPNTYPDLLTWLGTLGDPAVNAVLAARTTPTSVPSAPSPPPPPTRTPVLAPAQPGAPAPAAIPPQADAPTPATGRRRTGMWIAIGVVAVLLVAGGVTAALLLGRDTPARLAEPTPISTVFPDPSLAQCVADTLGVSSVDTLVTQDDLDALNNQDTLDSYNDYAGEYDVPHIDGTALECYEVGSDLTGIEYLTQLRMLVLEAPGASDIAPLAGLTNLEALSLGSTSVSDLDALTNLVNLRVLILDDLPVSDVSPLAGLANLQFLGLDYLPVSDVSPLANLTGLRQLYLYNTNVTDISPLDRLVDAGLYISSW